MLCLVTFVRGSEGIMKDADRIGRHLAITNIANYVLLLESAV